MACEVRTGIRTGFREQPKVKNLLRRPRRRWIYNSNIYLQQDGTRSQWPRSLRRESVATRLLGLRVRIPPGEWMSVCCDCCVLPGRYLQGAECGVSECDRETSQRKPWSTLAVEPLKKKNGRAQSGLICLRIGKVAACCEHMTDVWNYIKCT